jgi:multicomponent Na+:H+ antiporter subunit E
MLYALGLVIVLAALWFGLSGYVVPLLLAFGTGTVLLVVILAARLKILDREGVPYVRLPGFIAYFPWLLWQIVLSNLTVAKAILRPDLKLKPALVKVPTSCTSDLAKATFANSITLTPGTVTVEVEGNSLLVHALSEDGAAPDSFAEMDARSRVAMDGGRLNLKGAA